MKSTGLFAAVVAGIIILHHPAAAIAGSAAPATPVAKQTCGPAQPMPDTALLKNADTIKQLIDTGEKIRARRIYDSCKLNDVVDQDHQLADKSNALKSDIKKFNKDSHSFQARQRRLSERQSFYSVMCGNGEAGGGQCTDQTHGFNASSHALKMQSKDLEKRQQKLKKNAGELSGENKQLKKQYDSYLGRLKGDITYQASWLTEVRQIIGVSMLPTVEKNFGCPDLAKPVKTIKQLNELTDSTISCLKKVPRDD